MDTYSVYVIQSDLNLLYVGMTSDVTRRLEQHRRGECQQSRSRAKDPSSYKLVRYWPGLSLKDACRLELYLHGCRSKEIWCYVKANPKLTERFRSLWKNSQLGPNYTFYVQQQQERARGAEAAAANLDALLDQVF